MSREDFLFVLKEQVNEEIHTAFSECSHDAPGGGRKLDLPGLKTKVAKIRKSAKVQGLKDPDVDELLRAALPDLAETLGVAPIKKAA
jgi:hypothetical protein